MFAPKRKILALFAAALLVPTGIACGDASPTDVESESDPGTDPAPGSVETTRPEEG